MILYRKLQNGSIINPAIDMGTMSKDVVNLDYGRNIYQGALKQNQWHLNQINAPKYRERLIKEGYTADNVDAEIANRRSNIENVDIQVTSPGGVGAYLGDEDGFGTIAGAARFQVPENYPEYEIGQDYDEYSKNYDAARRPTVYLDSGADSHQMRPIGGHEGSHITEPFEEWDPKFLHHLYEPGLSGRFDEDYIMHPGETKARLDELRIMAHDMGIYDSATEDFTEEHYNALMEAMSARNNVDIERAVYKSDMEYKNTPVSWEEAEKKFSYPYNSNWRLEGPWFELEDSMQGEGSQGSDFKNKFIWMMNNIAQANSEPTTDSMV